MSRAGSRLWTRAVLLAPVVCAGVLTAQQPATTVKIVAPTEETYLSGPTRLVARFDPATATRQVEQVTFFANGKQVCRVVRAPYECDWDAGDRINEHTIRVVAIMRGSTSLVHTVRTKGVGYSEKVNVDVVQVTVTVSDEHGRFVRDLPQTAFKVSEDGHAQTITHFASEDVPLELIAAIDISGSMGPAMPRVKTAVKGFLGDVAPEHQVTLLGFNDNIFTLTRKTTDRAERIKAVDRLAPWGSTALYDVLLRGVEMLGRQVGRKALIVFSDGEDQGSHATINDVERRLQSSDVTLYMIAQGRGVTMEPLKRIMERLAAPTGGRALFTESMDELHTAFEQLLDELSNQYLLGYQSTNTRRDDAWRKIKVDVEGHNEVRARLGYRALAGK